MVRPQATAPVTLCGLEAIPECPKMLTLQRLLVEAGQNPGVLDGQIGPRTLAALAEVWPDRTGRLNVDEAIEYVDAYLCPPAPIRATPTQTPVQVIVAQTPQTPRIPVAPSVVQPALTPLNTDECILTMTIQRGDAQVFTTTQKIACPQE